MKTFHGYVRAPESMFCVNTEGRTEFRPINDSYGTVHPGDAAPRPRFKTSLSGLSTPDPVRVEFDLNDGKFFQVLEEIDKSEGRMGTRPAGNFLDYPSAYKAAAGKNVQGGRGSIVIMSPAGSSDLTAVDADGRTVLIEARTQWRSIRLASRLRFPDRDGAESQIPSDQGQR